jgi:hypothetical protein
MPRGALGAGGRATQNPLGLNIDMASVMQVRQWKWTRMPMRYGEHAFAAQGGMAVAAVAQGHEAIDG